MKKTIIMMLLIVMVLSLFAAPAFADKSSVEDLYESIKKDSIAGEITTQQGGPSETEILQKIDERVSANRCYCPGTINNFCCNFFNMDGYYLFYRRQQSAKTYGCKNSNCIFLYFNAIYFPC